MAETNKTVALFAEMGSEPGELVPRCGCSRSGERCS
jgi:hypothetical protein